MNLRVVGGLWLDAATKQELGSSPFLGCTNDAREFLILGGGGAEPLEGGGLRDIDAPASVNAKVGARVRGFNGKPLAVSWAAISSATPTAVEMTRDLSAMTRPSSWTPVAKASPARTQALTTVDLEASAR